MEISKHYGASEELYDSAYFRLEQEAFVFINDLLRRLPTFDKAAATEEARLLWDEMRTGTQTYEVGAMLYMIAGQLPSDSLPAGPDIMLHGAVGGWASDRFDGSEFIPPRHFAVTAELTTARPGMEALDSLARSRREEIEDALLARGLLPLRLAKPLLHVFVGSKYRVGVRGYREANKRAFHASEPNSVLARDSWAERLRAAEMADVVAIGRILSNLTRREDFIDRQYANNTLELSLRSFNSVYERKQWQDRVVDSAVVLEALFSRDVREPTYKASIRAAMLLGRSISDADRIFQTLKGFYNFRSKEVHAEPGALGKASRQVVQAWGRVSGLPGHQTRYIDSAARIGQFLVGLSLRSFCISRGPAEYQPVRHRSQSERSRLCRVR
jgi:hypothetical protein